MDTPPTSTTWIKDLLKAARIASGKTQYEFGEELGVSQTSISQWERGEQTPSVEVLARLLPYFGGDLNRARPDYDPAADVLRVAEVPAEYQAGNPQTLARLVADTRRRVLSEIATARPAPIPIHPVDDDTGAIGAPIGEAPGVEVETLAALFPLWRHTNDPTRLLRRTSEVDGFFQQETIAVRAAHSESPMFNRAQITAIHPKTGVETLCEFRAYLHHGKMPTWSCWPILKIGGGNADLGWGFDPRQCTGLVVAWLSAPPVPADIARNL